MSKQPTHRIKYKDADKVSHDIGVIWAGDRPGSFRIQFQEGDDTSGRFPKMDFDKARALHKQKRGFIDVYANEPRRDDSRGNGQQRTNTNVGQGAGYGAPQGGSDFGDDDIPFGPWVTP